MHLRLLDSHFFLSEAGEWALKVTFREKRFYIHRGWGTGEKTNLAEIESK